MQEIKHQTVEDEITAEEVDALKSFKGVILARGYSCARRGDDQSLLRFLRARQLDIKKAAAMYGELVHWRSENNIDSILQVCSMRSCASYIMPISEVRHVMCLETCICCRIFSIQN